MALCVERVVTCDVDVLEKEARCVVVVVAVCIVSTSFVDGVVREEGVDVK